MELDEFITVVPNFMALSDTEQIKHLGWFLNRHQGREVFDQAGIRECYRKLSMREPNISREFSRLRDRGEVLPTGGKYRLERAVQDALDRKYGEHQSTIAVKQLLADLPGKVSNTNEQTFLAEALSCYKVRAFRAATVMVWNLGYDHLLTWIVSDTKRLGQFNAGIGQRVGPKRAGIVIVQDGDFEDLKESEVLDIASSTNLITENLKKVMKRALEDRNLAAHPSGIDIAQPMADNMIYSLVTNVVLKLR